MGIGHRSEKVREEVQGKIKGRGTTAASSSCLHMGFCGTSKNRHRAVPFGK
jgi:hypothetical protein